MEDRKFRKFKDDIRKTFILYALIPVVIVTVSSYLIFLGMWYKTVTNQNINLNYQVSQRIEKILTSYINEACAISKKNYIIDLLQTGHNNNSIYSRLYSFVNSMDVRCNFFIFDKDMHPIIASTKNIPHYANSGNFPQWGIVRRMLDNPEDVVLERGLWKDNNKNVLTIGKAIVNNDEVKGYITFDLDERDLVKIINQNFSINIIITDKYDNIISSTNSLFVNKFDKIDENLKNKKGFIKTKNDNFYIFKSKLINDYIYVYTITSIGYMSSTFTIIGIFIILIFLMLISTMLLSAKNIANSKTKTIDNIIEAIKNVQSGDLNTQLNINTNDEFEIIAQSYNKMLTDIKKLIEINKEEARYSMISEIKQLESQFNPHFLFNTLEIIKYMIKIDPITANKILVCLSSLLRYSINNNTNKITLIDDIKYTQNYLLILKYRFGERFNYSINIEKEVESCTVPKLIVQPIIENAIEHGFEGKNYLNVEINATFALNKLIITIRDDGAGIDENQLEKIRLMLSSGKNSSSHFGIFNVHRRIQLMYGKNYGIEIYSKKDEGTTVNIILPITREEF
ncbi:MAG TPA: histidine kinase [Clostridia bacterium]|nr:histidine kinase [Clostridia bacterium]